MLNEADMSRWCRQLADINRLLGSKSPHAIPVQCDYMYNNPLYSGIGKTQFQPATQTVYSFAEDVTSKRQIIKMVTKNTMCSKHGHLLDESNASHSCSPEVCGAILPMHHTTGDEYTWAIEGMAGLLSQGGVEVKGVTTKQDSGAGRAGQPLFKDGLQANLPAEKTKHLGYFALDVVNRFSIALNVNLSPPNDFIITKNTYMYHHLKIQSKG